MFHKLQTVEMKKLIQQLEQIKVFFYYKLLNMGTNIPYENLFCSPLLESSFVV